MLRRSEFEAAESLDMITVRPSKIATMQVMKAFFRALFFRPPFSNWPNWRSNAKDVLIAVFKKMRVIQASGNGRCLFVSLRLALECTAILSMDRKGQCPKSVCLDGHSKTVTSSAEDLAQLICKWYSSGLDKEISSFGSYVQSGRQWCKRDILAMEMVQRGRDIPEDGPERHKAALDYLQKMQRPGTWGSTPEYTAFAFMSKLKVEVYQPQQSQSSETPMEFKSRGLNLINTVEPPNAVGTIRLLYNGVNHYNLLLSDEDHINIKRIVPEAL